MVRYTITIETGNASFEDDFNGTIDALLAQAAHKIKNESGLKYTLRDLYGNTVGTVKRKFMRR